MHVWKEADGNIKVFYSNDCHIFNISAPATDVRLQYSKPDSRTINLTCKANGVFPKPEVTLSWGPQ